MKNEELKLQSIEKIKTSIKILSDNKEKITNKRISELSGLSEITVKRYKKEAVSPIIQNVSAKTKNVSPIKEALSKPVSPKTEIVSATIKILQENIKSVSAKKEIVSPQSKKNVSPTERFKPLKPSHQFSNTYNQFLLRCIKDSNIKSAYLTTEELETIF